MESGHCQDNAVFHFGRRGCLFQRLGQMDDCCLTRNLAIGGDGLFQVRVKSDKGRLSEANVSPVPVMLDATPPPVVLVTLSAVE